VKISRRTLLLQRRNALSALRNPMLPAALKALAKKAADHAEVALGLDRALRTSMGLTGTSLPPQPQEPLRRT
jgi:hypothetical protein